MNTLLIFFAFPIAVIIVSIILQKILDNPIAVAAAIFAFFIVITFAFFDETFLIATLAYTILSFLTAFLVSRLCDENNNNNCLCNTIADILQNNNNNNNNNLNSTNNTANASLQDLLNNINSNNNSNNCGCNNNDNDDVLGISNNNSCGCGRMRKYRKF